MCPTHAPGNRTAELYTSDVRAWEFKGARGARGLERAPRGPRDGPVQGAPERPRRAQYDLQGGSDSPRRPKMVPKMLKTAPRPLQERPRMLHESPKQGFAGPRGGGRVGDPPM
eukprot:6500471-Pyramimonas_sp.AAC.1